MYDLHRQGLPRFAARVLSARQSPKEPKETFHQWEKPFLRVVEMGVGLRGKESTEVTGVVTKEVNSIVAPVVKLRLQLEWPWFRRLVWMDVPTRCISALRGLIRFRF